MVDFLPHVCSFRFCSHLILLSREDPLTYHAHSWLASTPVQIQVYPNCTKNRRKFRSQTSDNMDRWTSRVGKSQRREEKSRGEERRREERRRGGEERRGEEGRGGEGRGGERRGEERRGGEGRGGERRGEERRGEARRA